MRTALPRRAGPLIAMVVRPNTRRIRDLCDVGEGFTQVLNFAHLGSSGCSVWWPLPRRPAGLIAAMAGNIGPMDLAPVSWSTRAAHEAPSVARRGGRPALP